MTYVEPDAHADPYDDDGDLCEAPIRRCLDTGAPFISQVITNYTRTYKWQNMCPDAGTHCSGHHVVWPYVRGRINWERTFGRWGS